MSASSEFTAPRYSFSGHEGFPFRYTWLPKAMQWLSQRPDLFVSDDAPVVLGVGKNMVSSIRHWCTALEMIEPVGRMGHFRPTEIGSSLFGQGGWDPFLEDVGTLWLLHWRLASRPWPASTWYLAFTRWNTEFFTRDQLVEWLEGVSRRSSSTRTSTNSLRRDADVFVRSYVQARSLARGPAEDTFDCPLVELGMIEEEERGLFRFVRAARPSLPTEIFASALHNYWDLYAPDRGSLSFERLYVGSSSVGGAFKLSEHALAERLETLPDWTGLRYDETAGMRMVLRVAMAYERSLGEQSMLALGKYYGSNLDKEV